MRVKSLRRPSAARLLTLGLLVAPAGVLAGVAAIYASAPLAVGAAVVGLVTATLSKPARVWRSPTGGPLVAVYVLAAGWVWVNTRETAGSLPHVARGALLLAAAGLLAAAELHRTGAEPRRRAKRICDKLQARRWWPPTLGEIRGLGDVSALRDAADVDPGPVFQLFHDPRPQVRAAAFAALEGRVGLRPREACALLVAARKTTEPDVRAVAVGALAAADEPAAVAGLTEFFRDPHADVRQAAVRAALYDGGRKWAFVRDGVRLALSDLRSSGDGPLLGAAGHLPVVALCDLTAWSGEPEPLGGRSTRTLIAHYTYALDAGTDFELPAELGEQLLDPHTPAALRVELATLLRSLGRLTPELLDRMTNAEQPGPVRLLAAEALLAANPHDPDGLDVLRGLARQPNREMALSIAGILQQRLGIDMGLPSGALVPTSRPAGDVARKVLAWATSKPAAVPPKAKPPVLPETPAPTGPLPGGRLKSGVRPW